MPVFFLVFILYGCVNNQVIIHKEYESERMYNDNHGITFELYLENIGNPKKTQKLVNELVYNGKNFDEYREFTEQNFILGINKNNYPGVINEDGTAYIYHSELNKKHSIIFNDDQFIIFENKLWFYTGGSAHGNQLIEYIIIDLQEKKILDKNDLLNQMPENLLKENILKKYGKNDFQREDVWPPDTINFNNGFVELIWNTYSILPYADGTISLELKHEVIEQYLTKKGKKVAATVYKIIH